jgi:hypothetical protein
MKIPKGVPDPAKVAKKITGPTLGPRAGRTEAADAKRAEGIHSAPGSSPSANSLAVTVLNEMAKAGLADLREARQDKASAYQAKIGAKEAEMAQMAERQAKERDSAWINVGMAVASASVGAAAGVVGAGASATTSALQGLAIGQRKALVDTIGAVQQGATDAAKAAFEKVADGAMPQDINGLVQHVLRESYLETSKDLAFYADKVKHFNDQKDSIRDRIGQARSGRADQESVIKALEEKLASVGDDSQLANIDLQNALQKQQQVLQTMANMSKLLHDSAMAVIRKMGG